jgi:hypothetical protein
VNSIASLFSLAKHGEVETAAFALKETSHHVAAIKSIPKFEVRHSRLIHHELG